MPTRLFCALVILATVPIAVRGQTVQEIRGRVVQDGTGAAMEGVELALLDDTGAELVRTASDGDGAFRLTVPIPGTYTLRATRLGFRTVEARSLAVRADEVVELLVRLAVDAIPLEPLTIVARATRADHRLTGFRERSSGAGVGAFGQFVTRREIDRRARMLTSDLLRPLRGISLVRIASGDFGPERNLIYLTHHSGRKCNPTIYVDGNRLPQTRLSTIDDYLSPNALEGVEVYSGIGPPQFSGGECGLILFWTREPEARRPGKRIGWKALLLGAGGIAALFVLIF